MSGLSAERVLAASEAWTWIPALAPRVRTEEFLVVLYPPWWEHRLQVVRFAPRRPVAEVLDDVVAAGRELSQGIDGARLVCWVRLDAPAGLEQELTGRGAPLVETVDVLALGLAEGGPAPLDPSSAVELRWSQDPEVFLDAADLVTEVFGGRVPDRAELEAAHPGEADKVRGGGGGTVVAYLDGRPVGTGGVTMAGPDARLWGGAVLPAARGRGVYRALLAARLDYAAACRAELAIVKGRVETSGPILRRAGFRAFGQERSYRLEV